MALAPLTPRMHQWVACTKVMVTLLLTYLHILKLVYRHFVARRLAILFRVAVAPPPAARQRRKQKKRIVDVVGGKPPDTYSSSPAPLLVDTFPVSSPNGTNHLCSQRACREQCQSHSARGHGSGGHPSFPLPLAVACRLGLLWLWSFPDFPSSSSWHNLQR